MSGEPFTAEDDTALDPVDVGLDWFVGSPPGTGGRLRDRPEDFRVDERADAAAGDTGGYLLLRATLRDRETHRFARDLSNALGISRQRVAWAGTKDRRAVTTQLVTVYDVDEDDVAAVALPGVELEVLGRRDHELGLGDLRGNAFAITIRDVERPERFDAIAEELEAFGGYPNCFGPQRFGSRRPITHAVGEAILRDDLAGAVDTYLAASFPAEPEATREARDELAAALDGAPATAADAVPEPRRDVYREALDGFPEHLGFERALLNALVDGGSPRDALDALPDNLQRLFVNAAQSRLFNVILRRRHDAGLPFDAAVEGDVVCFTEEADVPGGRLPDTDDTQRVTASNVDTVNRHVRRGRALVTAPVPGSETAFGDGEPDGETAAPDAPDAHDAPDAIVRGVLDDAGLAREAFDRDDGYGARGTRRPVLLTPDVAADVDADEATIELAFFLPKGCYATAVTREYLRPAPPGGDAADR